MEYKKDDTVKLLKDYTISFRRGEGNPGNVKRGSFGKIVLFHKVNSTVFVKFKNPSSSSYKFSAEISVEIAIKDLEFVEREGCEVGTCPFCEKEGNLDYGTLEIIDEQIMYPWGCPDCGGSGEEWYRMEFIDMIGKKLE